MGVLFEIVVRKYPTILDYIREKKYKIGDTELSYRQINGLDESGLIENTRESDKDWRKFNLNDLLYLHIINQAREFNLNNSQLKDLKDLFYKHKLNRAIGGEVLFSEEALIGMLVGVVPIGILIFSDGMTILSDDPSIAITHGFTDPNRRANMYIMLYETFQPYIAKVKSDASFAAQFDMKQFEDDYSTKLISRQDRALLKIVEENQYSHISITKKPDGKLIVEAERSLDGTHLTKEDILEILEKQDFGKVETNKKNGGIANLKIRDIYKI